ncbi:MAG: ComF family protein [Clostridia bacterium]|nr:ComF family protein [Clostridia bacterium]
MPQRLSTFKKYLKLAGGLLFVPKCPGCGEVMPLSTVTDREGVLCDRCLDKWYQEKLTCCKGCGKSYPQCMCPTDALLEAGCGVLISLVPYDKNARTSRNVVSKLIYEIKDTKNRALTDFLAFELASALEFVIRRLGAANCVVTYAPRSNKAINEKGHDQSYLLAGAFASLLELPFAKCFRRVSRLFGERTQKELDESERILNARRSYSFNPKRAQFVKDKCVILIDDLVTTGASLAACTDLLVKNGAQSIICVTVAASIAEKEEKEK